MLPTHATASVPVGTIGATPDDRPDPGRRAAYRRLAVTILGLDVPTLVAELQARRQAEPRPPARLHPALRRAA